MPAKPHPNLVCFDGLHGASQDCYAAEIGRRLGEDNRMQHGVAHDAAPWGVYALDADGTLQGGVTGKTVWGWLHVSLLWVAPKARGMGLGRQLMERAHALGRARGARWARVKTTAFQARSFYERFGYEVFAELPIVVPAVAASTAAAEGSTGQSTGGRESTEFYLKRAL